LDGVDQINTTHQVKNLPGIVLSSSIKATSDMSVAKEADVIILAVPSQALRSVLEVFKLHIDPKKSILVIACKGIEKKTSKLMSEVVEEVLPESTVAAISGPNFASEVAQTLPAAATLACSDQKAREKVLKAIGYINFKLYLSDDIIGVQIGGALKNVIAIATGIASGRGMGDNTIAFIITRGLAEISRLGVEKKAKSDTFYGLSGIGDLMLTCMSSQSRNYKLGRSIGRGAEIDDILDSTKMTVEGFHTAESIIQLAKKLKVDMPICQMVHSILYQGKTVNEAINTLLTRPVRQE
jgi:glycerol-3-phosphate dehydrogenase (NAD(P)+)